jgi:hypothetical protein
MNPISRKRQFLSSAALALACAGAPLLAHAAALPGINPDEAVSDSRSNIRTINQMARMKPPVSSGVAAGATAQCVDGSISRDKDPLSACAYRGGVQRWFAPVRDRSLDNSQTALYPG